MAGQHQQTPSLAPLLLPFLRMLEMMALTSFVTICLSLCLQAVAVALPENNPASLYMGVKVVRVPTGPSVEILQRLESVVSDLNLELWTGTPRINAHVDVEVPPAVYDAFMSATNELLSDAGILQPVTIMHEDLGMSILDESNVPNDFHQEVKRACKCPL